MKKIFILFSAAVVGITFITTPVFAEGESTAEVEKLIKTHCSIIKDNLKTVQYEDSRVRVHLGRYYETILNNFITPLNLALVATDKTNLNLIENQNDFSAARNKFSSDYISYQKGLEALVAMDCASDPVKFYEKLVDVRTMRAKVASDTTKLRELTDKQVRLVNTLKETL